MRHNQSSRPPINLSLVTRMVTNSVSKTAPLVTLAYPRGDTLAVLGSCVGLACCHQIWGETGVRIFLKKKRGALPAPSLFFFLSHEARFPGDTGDSKRAPCLARAWESVTRGVTNPSPVVTGKGMKL